MNTGKLYLYGFGSQPISYPFISRNRLFEFLAPHLEQSKQWADKPRVLAEVDFPNCNLLWFSSLDGSILMHLETPLLDFWPLRGIRLFSRTSTIILSDINDLRSVLECVDKGWGMK